MARHCSGATAKGLENMKTYDNSQNDCVVVVVVAVAVAVAVSSSFDMFDMSVAFGWCRYW